MGPSSSTTWTVDSQSVVHSIVLCLKKRWNPLFTINTGKLTNGVIFHYDDAQPHTAAVTVETIWKPKFKLLLHSAYSPDLIPFYYHIFRSFKDVLCRCQFANSKEVKDAVHMWLCTQLKIFFADDIRKLVDWTNKCMEKLGDYVKKVNIFVLGTFCRIKRIINCPVWIPLKYRGLGGSLCHTVYRKSDPQ